MRGHWYYVLFMVAACFLSMALSLGLVLIAANGWPKADWPFILAPVCMLLFVFWFDRIAYFLFTGGE